MYTIPDLGIPEVKPAIELYEGVRRQKMSPQFTHARLQMKCAALLDAWAYRRGRVGTEWRFYFIERAGAPSSLVPDVAYVSFERLPYEADVEAERPTIAPDIAIEILSPDDRPDHVRQKIALYLQFGTAMVVVVNAADLSLTVYRSDETTPQIFKRTGRAHITGDFEIDLATLFARAEAPLD
ncbi:MAG: hypothetical protein NVS3B28_03870 [Candidatus Velthaea sp.]